MQEYFRDNDLNLMKEPSVRGFYSFFHDRKDLIIFGTLPSRIWDVVSKDRPFLPSIYMHVTPSMNRWSLFPLPLKMDWTCDLLWSKYRAEVELCSSGLVLRTPGSDPFHSLGIQLPGSKKAALQEREALWRGPERVMPCGERASWMSTKALVNSTKAHIVRGLRDLQAQPNCQLKAAAPLTKSVPYRAKKCPVDS